MTDDILQIVWLSLRVSGVAVVLASVLGIPCGILIGLGRFPGRTWVIITMRTGMAMPPVAVGLLLYLLLSRSGPLGQLEWLFTARAMILAQTILALPFIVSIVITSMESIAPGLREQLVALGASKRQIEWLLFREARRGILLAIAAALGRSLSEVGAVMIVGGNVAGHTRVLTTSIVLETSKGEFRTALALGGILVMLALTINFLLIRFRWSMS